MRFFISISVIIVLSLTTSRAWAYAVLDRVKMSTLPTIWRKTSDNKIQYHIKYRTGNSAYVYLKTDSAEPMDLNYQIIGYQKEPQKTRVEPGTINVVETSVSLADQRLAFALLQTSFENGSAKAPPTNPNVADDSGYFVSLAHEDVDFNPNSIGYFIKQRNENVAEVHFRNYTDKRIHFDFKIVGYQPDNATPNPRLSVDPGWEVEVFPKISGLNAGIRLAIAEIYNVRVGTKDEGPLRVAAEQTGPVRLVREPDWTPLSVQNEAPIDFNPAAVIFRCRRKAGSISQIEFKNLSTQAVHFDFWVLNRQQKDTANNPRVSIQAGASVEIEIKPIKTAPAELIYICANKIRINKDDGPFIEQPEFAVTSPREDEWLAATTVNEEEPQFSPRMVGYTIKRTSATSAEVQFKNLCGTPIHYDFYIAGYQPPEATNRRISLQASESVTIPIQVAKADTRIAIAKVKVFNIRFGVDQGEVISARK